MDAVTTWREQFPVLQDRRLPLNPAWPPGSTAQAARPRAGRPRLAQHRRARPLAGRPARPDRAARLLDLLLHQLPARARRAAPARGEVRRLAGADRRALAEVRARGRPRRAGRRRRALRRAPPGARRPRARHLAGLHRPRLADAGGHRPRGLHRRADVGRGPRPRPVASSSRSSSPSTTPRARCARATRRTCRRRPPRPRCASRARSPRCPTARSSSPTPRTTSWSQLEPDLVTERRAGSAADGGHVLSEPQGVLVLPAGDGRAGRLRRRRGRHRPPPGQGAAARRRHGRHARRHRPSSCASARAAGPRCEQDLSTPWDLAWFIDRVVIAMAGIHQLWALHLATDPADNTVAVLGGTSAEGIRDGAADEAWFAQPSGLAASADGSRLWVADSETSALRSLDRHRRRLRRDHPRRAGLFDFGHRDGAADQALLQHPLGVTVLPDGSVAISDTYNGAIRRFDPVDRRGQHPGHGPARAQRRGRRGRRRRGDAARGRRVGGPPARAGAAAGQAPSGSTAWPAQTQRPPHRRRRRRRHARRSTFTPPTGQKLDHRWGDPTRLMVSATPAALLRRGRWQRRRA